MRFIFWKGLVRLEQLIGQIVTVLLKTPYGFVILMFVLIMIIFIKALKMLQREFHTRFDDIEKEVLKLQILSGIDSKRFSLSELNYFSDRYLKLGGNSFVEEKVQQYKEELKEKPHD